MGRGKHPASLALIEEARVVLEEIHPASVRAVCYQLFIRNKLESMAAQNTKRVGNQLVYAREHDIIPWEWVVDETRGIEKTPTWSTPDAFVDTALWVYRKDWWDTQSVRLQVWSEKGTVRGTVQPLLTQYALPFLVVHGFGSATVVHGLSEQSREDPRPLIVLYVGDWDPSGMCMSETDLPGRIERYGGQVHVQRVALTRDDTTTGLPSFAAATKVKDARYRWFVENYGTACWELDAMNPIDLRDRLDAAIRSHIDMDAWARYEHIERAERKSLTSFLHAWRDVHQSPETPESLFLA